MYCIEQVLHLLSTRCNYCKASQMLTCKELEHTIQESHQSFYILPPFRQGVYICMKHIGKTDILGTTLKFSRVITRTILLDNKPCVFNINKKVHYIISISFHFLISFSWKLVKSLRHSNQELRQDKRLKILTLNSRQKLYN